MRRYGASPLNYHATANPTKGGNFEIHDETWPGNHQPDPLQSLGPSNSTGLVICTDIKKKKKGKTKKILQNQTTHQ